MSSDVGEGNSTTFCPYCNIHLAYPVNASLIQCPQCQETLDPRAPHQIRCTGCACLLAYPPNSLYIQCPKCLNTMDPRQQPSVNESQSSSSRKSDGGHSSSAAGGSSEPKKRRDPNMPKAFCKSRRNELKYENPDLPFGKIGAKLGEMWRNMSTEEKRPYEERASVDRERYRKEMVNYQAGQGAEKKRQKVEEEDEDGGGGSSNHSKAPKFRKVEKKVQEDDEEDNLSEEDE